MGALLAVIGAVLVGLWNAAQQLGEDFSPAVPTVLYIANSTAALACITFLYTGLAPVHTEAGILAIVITPGAVIAIIATVIKQHFQSQ